MPGKGLIISSFVLKSPTLLVFFHFAERALMHSIHNGAWVKVNTTCWIDDVPFAEGLLSLAVFFFS